MSLVSRISVADGRPAKDAELVMGEDWTQSDDSVEHELRTKREKRSFISLNRSPLARKIITFNLLALIVLVAGVLFLNPFRDSLVAQREMALVSEAQLIADVFEAQLEVLDTQGSEAQLRDPAATLRNLDIDPGVDVYVFSPDENLMASVLGEERPPLSGAEGLQSDDNGTIITGFLNSVWETISGAFGSAGRPTPSVTGEDEARQLLSEAAAGATRVRTGQDGAGGSIFSVATPIELQGQVIGVIALSTVAGQIDELVRAEREQVLQMFVIAILVSIGLSLVLASTIANPLSDLAAAAELGQDKSARKVSPSRVRIPDLTARPDEIGRLSGAMRGMVSALYERIDANEQFAADVAHEIKNPLASLRSAVGTLHVAKTQDQRVRLLDVIEHDVRRLDRLVSDISNASRLDSELVKEDEEPFDLMRMIHNLSEYLGQQAAEQGVEFIRDVPSEPIIIHGLEARLAQVFVNLITNATSFCEDGDAVRIWARKRDNRVLVVVEDTGPGIPEQALNKVFNRFYSERPERQFGNHSGLGLAISKQIVEAHGGVIWAENIRPTDADVTSEPLGARFVVGLPI
ncbi:two-component system sensor histidine kinase ChvG [Litoreibacter ponti]|uniref:histidine kinase n=1 Tax=Litoreibacter ponti TaxID=1510457 RepID=A0A2T6BMM4_9RHOB|nr:sensor histidine kinase [Litoreibacter ponti]PTX57284.1 two-component system sensor histidine kinase ChvG [Litoreibacter ponti]